MTDGEIAVAVVLFVFLAQHIYEEFLKKRDRSGL